MTNKLISKNDNDFFDRVYSLVEKIPYGKVTTYGALAEACGIKSGARTVGWAMNAAHGTDLPCHRVVNRNGDLTGKFHFGNPNLMRDLLESEGIKFNEKNQVIMQEYLWIPPRSTNRKK